MHEGPQHEEEFLDTRTENEAPLASFFEGAESGFPTLEGREGTIDEIAAETGLTVGEIEDRLANQQGE